MGLKYTKVDDLGKLFDRFAIDPDEDKTKKEQTTEKETKQEKKEQSNVEK